MCRIEEVDLERSSLPCQCSLDVVKEATGNVKKINSRDGSILGKRKKTRIDSTDTDMNLKEDLDRIIAGC